MSETIQKIERYIARTKIGENYSYCLDYAELLALMNEASTDPDVNSLFKVITTAFNYGCAKGVRAERAAERGSRG